MWIILWKTLAQLVENLVENSQLRFALTHETDKPLNNKFDVKEYWILDPKTRSAEIYCLTDKGMKLTQTCKDNDEITTPLLPDFVCKASSLF